MVAIIAFWLLAVGIYAWAYRIGFAVLLTLSLGHVILEFPLNHQTIWESERSSGNDLEGTPEFRRKAGCRHERKHLSKNLERWACP